MDRGSWIVVPRATSDEPRPTNHVPRPTSHAPRTTSPFEYILPLFAVLVGLAIADVAVSLHRMLRARRRVTWDWLPLASVLIALLVLLEVWWRFFDSQDAAFYTSMGGFLPLLGQMLILFLLTAAALPDDVPPDGIDLRDFYDENGSYFWSLFATYVGFLVLVRIAGSLFGSSGPSSPGGPGGPSFGATIVSLIPNLVMLAAMITLVRVRRRLLHAVAMVAFLVMFLGQWWGLRL